jgi:hypothetical protein
MIASDGDEQQWRITCARILLCVSILYYLATLLIMSLGRHGLPPWRAVSQILVLLALSASATIGLSRSRAPSIVAIAIVALISIWLLSTGLFDSRLLSAMTDRIGKWRTGLVILTALAFNLLPAIAFLVVWPFRPPSPVQRPGGNDYS